MSKEAVVDKQRKLIEYRKGNFLVTVPSSWRKLNKLDASVPIRMFFSRISKGYLMIGTDELVKRKIDLRDVRINLSRTKELMIDASERRAIDRAFFEDVLREQARFELVSLVLHGYSAASIVYDAEDKYDFEKVYMNFKTMEKRLDKAVSLNGKHIFRIDIDPESNYITATIHERDERDPLEYEYSELTRIMLNHHIDLFDKVIECINKNLKQDLYEQCSFSEGSLDFLWFYYLRQLKKGVDVGLFSGIELSGMHVVCLSMFSKMLEHNADSLMRVLSLLDYLKQKANEKQDFEFFNGELVQFMKTITNDLVIIRSECNTLMNILPDTIDISIEGELSKESHEVVKSIAGTIAFYHGQLVKEVGEVSESYVTQRDEKSLQELEKVLFGKYQAFVNDIERKYPGRGYGFVLSQVASELRSIAKFPRNIAVIAIGILAPMIHKV